MNILALLQMNQNGLSKTPRCKMGRIITAMLSMTVRVTRLGLSCWAGEGGSYRAIQLNIQYLNRMTNEARKAALELNAENEMIKVVNLYGNLLD